jgi:hypothetical protein
MHFGEGADRAEGDDGIRDSVVAGFDVAEDRQDKRFHSRQSYPLPLKY